MRLLFALLGCLACAAQADEAPLRHSASLLFKHPAMLKPGQCVRYEEGGAGWVVSEPVYYLKGEVLSAEVRTRQLGKCPVVSGKSIAQYSRDEFNRHALAYPCVSPEVPERNAQIGVVRLRVTDWETPHAKKAENAGRLYRGLFIDRKLEKDMEIELEADLLGPCEP